MENILELNLNSRNLTDEQFYSEIAKYPNLQILSCSCNKITNLDHLPIGLQKLNCRNNQLTSLDHLPIGLQKLDCEHNQITNLDHLPSEMQQLYCGYNKITNLDHLPSELQILWCGGNQITSLDYLPSKIKGLSCDIYKFTVKLNNSILYVKRGKYLRFLRNLKNMRKTHGYLVLRELRKTSPFYENCLPDEIIRHIVSFV